MTVAVALRRLTFGLGGLVASAASALACAICLSAVSVSPGQKLGNADLAVVIAVSEDGSRWQILDRIKGEDLADPSRIAADIPVAPSADSAPVLAIRNGLGKRWSSLGEVGLDHVDWLRALANRTPPGADANPQEWHGHLQLVSPMLDGTLAGIEGLARGELTRAPYPAIRDLGAGWKTDEIIAMIGPADDPDHVAAFILMLGAAGGEGAAAWVDAALAAPEAQPLGVTAALIAARLDLGGAAQVDWVEETYLLDPQSDPVGVEAALLALSTHGDLNPATAHPAVPRARIVEAFQKFIHQRPAMASFVATDLARWKEWGATGDYVALLNAGVITDPASVFAALNYVHLSDDVAAKSMLDLRHD
ncbi:hypothetical protein KHP62_09180 [Rhodobacteraceae bacterium NNCM2]|nr:hypothetical protein [Coraliihabitans acroporae]